LGAIFPRIFREFAQIFRDVVKIFTDFAQIFTDFVRIFREFARIFTKSKLLGMRLHPCIPASYTTDEGLQISHIFSLDRGAKIKHKIFKTWVGMHKTKSRTL